MKLLLLYNLWNFKNEIRIVVISFILILLLPIVAVIILVNTGVNVVSDKLASIDSKTNQVQIHDQLTGEVKETINKLIAWPVKGIITLKFGESDFPYQIFHTGIDIANPNGKEGDPITTFMSGKVTYAGEIFWGYGKHIIIDHGDNITSLYGHLSKIYVYPGQKVNPGDTIGLEGTSGWSTGPHLHFEIRVFGIPVNPRTFLGN